MYIWYIGHTQGNDNRTSYHHSQDFLVKFHVTLLSAAPCGHAAWWYKSGRGLYGSVAIAGEVIIAATVSSSSCLMSHLFHSRPCAAHIKARLPLRLALQPGSLAQRLLRCGHCGHYPGGG
jgi:hypothetical protein